MCVFTMSHRSALRKAPTALGWSSSLMKLHEGQRMSPLAVLAAWNESAPLSDRVVGRKALGVKVLIGLLCAVFRDIQPQVSKHGMENTPHTEANLSLKK